MKYKVLKKQNNAAKCFVCGVENEFGLKARFYDCENEAGEKVLLAVFTPHENHQSYPNRMHGGIIAALLDEAVGRAVQIESPEIWGVTIDLNVKYRKPVPLDQELYIEAKTTEKTRRTFDGAAKLFTSDGTVCANATGRYFSMPLDEITKGGLGEKDWSYIDEELPDEIVIE